MAKDPAALLYIDKWLVSTKGMRANAKGWYLNLILFQYDMGDLPTDIEELANLCDVRMSEYKEFEQVFEQVLKQKFELNENNRYENAFAREILQKREIFKDKRSDAGKMSYVLRYLRKKHKFDDDFEKFFKDNVTLDFDTKDEQVIEQVFKQISELYINVNKDIVIIKEEDIEFIYSLYPSKCLVQKERSLGKSKSDKNKIKTLLKTKTKEELQSIIERYKIDCVSGSVYMKNFSTFLNQLPDYSETDLLPKKPKSKPLDYT